MRPKEVEVTIVEEDSDVRDTLQRISKALETAVTRLNTSSAFGAGVEVKESFFLFSFFFFKKNSLFSFLSSFFTASFFLLLSDSVI